jgi:ubiquitin C-terminal hydrolase
MWQSGTVVIPREFKKSISQISE